MHHRIRASLLALGIAVLAVMFGGSMLAVPAAADEEAEQEAEQSIGGTLRDGEGEPVAGVTIAVTDSDGAEVGEGVTDDEGQWTVPLPAGGTYTVLLLEETLPDEIELRDPDRNPLEVQVRPGTSRPAVFQLGEDSGARGQLEAIGRAVGNGVKFGLIIAMCAVGLSLIFGTTGLINFSHGELVALGGLLAWFFNVTLGIHLIPAAIITIILVAGFGSGLEKGMFLPLRRRRLGLFQLLVITIGLALAIRFLNLLFFGGAPRTYRDYVGQQAVQLGPISLTPRDMIIIGLSVVILVAVATVLQKTKIGKAVRAVSDNPALASASGIDVDRVTLFVWTAGAGLAATGGIFFGSAVAADYFMGFRLLLLMFAAVILGGIGTAYGAMVGGLIIGLVTELSVLWSPAELKIMWALLALIIALLVRPQGILGRAERVG